MATDVDTSLPQLDLTNGSLVTVTLDDPNAIVASVTVHGWQEDSDAISSAILAVAGQSPLAPRALPRSRVTTFASTEDVAATAAASAADDGGGTAGTAGTPAEVLPKPTTKPAAAPAPIHYVLSDG